MDNPIIFQILLALVALFFIFLTYMNTKTWRWLHVTIAIFLFIAVIPFGVYAAMTLRTRLAWIGLHDKLEKDVERVTDEVELAMYGDPADVEGNSDSVVDLRGNVARTILDRGRVWRGLTATPAGNGYVIQTAPPQDPALPAAPVVKHNIEPKTVLFAFKEATTADGLQVPFFYLGEFRVANVSDTSVTVEPVIPQTPEQQGVSRDPNPIILGPPPASQVPPTWTLYEVMPVDGHDWFAGKTEEELRALMPMQMTGLAQPQYDKFISQFVRDGQAADEVNDPPENIWYEVEFLKPYSMVIDAPAVASIDSEAFDSEGRAVLDRLRAAEPGAEDAKSEFKVGDKGFFDKATTDRLVADGTAKIARPIFRRRLNDFELKFHAVNTQIVELNSRIRALTADVASIQASKAKADRQAMLLEDYKTKLNDDLAKVKFELTELTGYAASLTNRLGEVRTELSTLYRSNKALSRELASLNAQMTEDIERRTRAATASAN
jgi:hypothetical protein